MNNSVTEEMVEDKIIETEWQTVKSFGKPMTVVSCLLSNGFIITETSTCCDPKNYDAEIGKDICLARIKQKIWELEGYLLCEKLSGHVVDASECEECPLTGLKKAE